jgi:hypothetical protein
MKVELSEANAPPMVFSEVSFESKIRNFPKTFGFCDLLRQKARRCHNR